MDTTANNRDNNQAGNTSYSDLAKLASQLTLISSTISNYTDDDNLFILASIIGLIAGILINKAAFLEAEAQQIAPGVTTFANRLKIIGTTVSLASSLILFWALLIEVSLRSQGVRFGTSASLAGSTGALMV
jgi:hypothetical protein